jgi:hypothetical protein
MKSSDTRSLTIIIQEGCRLLFPTYSQELKNPPDMASPHSGGMNYIIWITFAVEGTPVAVIRNSM